MTLETKPDAQGALANAAAQGHRQSLIVRRGRGRTGGSTGLDVWIQRARAAGRRVKPLDGDLRSKTLSTLYPAHDGKGKPVQDGAGSPATEEMADMRDWLSTELDTMIANGTSAVLDLGGGDRVVQEYVRELAVNEFCRDNDIQLIEAFFLGTDQEDFEHVMQILEADELKADCTMFVMNEGVIRHGETTAGVFDRLMTLPKFKKHLLNGVRPVFMRRLSCMNVVRERGLGFYDAVAGKPDRNGDPASPTLKHMIKTWLKTIETDHEAAGTLEWLP